MLSVRGLTKTFGATRPGATTSVVALDGVDLDVADGAFATVLGPSGCGKTTLLRAIAGFEEPDSGSIEIAGRQVSGPGRRGAPAHTRGVGIVPQEGALFPHLSVGQNVAFGLAGLPRRDRAARVADVLGLVGLDGLAHRRPSQLSGGQQQRVALARALAPSPRMILLDEPFSALDAHLRRDLRAEVRQLLQGIGTTALLVTHDQAEALTMADHLVVMRRGRVISSGDPRDTYFRPADLELARFLGDAVVVPGWMVSTDPAAPVVSCALGDLPVRAWHGGAGGCEVMIRPENIAIRSAAADDAVTGTVVGQSFFGHDELVHVALANLAAPIAVRISGDRRFVAGDTVAVTVERDVCTYSRDEVAAMVSA